MTNEEKKLYQDTFNKVWFAINEQKRPSQRYVQRKYSQGQDLLCAYRGSNGNKCAIGHLIPDNEYYPSIEGLYLLTVVETVPTLKSFQGDMTFLRDLQNAHDSASEAFSFLGTFKMKMEAIATEWGLTFPSV